MSISVLELIKLCICKIHETNTSWKSRLVKSLLFSIRSYFFDLYYDICSLGEIHEALEKFKNELESLGIEYIPDSFDCDDYASAFKAFFSLHYRKNSVGIAIGRIYYGKQLIGYHAWNIVLLTGGVLAFVEPQTFEVFFTNVSPDDFTYELETVIW